MIKSGRHVLYEYVEREASGTVVETRHGNAERLVDVLAILATGFHDEMAVVGRSICFRHPLRPRRRVRTFARCWASGEKDHAGESRSLPTIARTNATSRSSDG
jgi:hypothetical protein